MVAGVGVHQAVVGRRARVECGGHPDLRSVTAHPCLAIAQPLTLPQQQHGGHQCEAEQEILDGNVERKPDAAGVAVVVDDDRCGQLGEPAVDGDLKANTITIEIQYAGLRKRPVCSTPNSNAHTAITASTAGSV